MLNAQGEISQNFAPESERCDKLKSEFSDVFPQDLPGHLPPDRGQPFKIETEPGATPVNRPIYRLSPSELEELRRTLDDLLAKGFIRPSNSPWGCPGPLCPQEGRGLCAFASTTGGLTSKRLKMPTPSHAPTTLSTNCRELNSSPKSTCAPDIGRFLSILLTCLKLLSAPGTVTLSGWFYPLV